IPKRRRGRNKGCLDASLGLIGRATAFNSPEKLSMKKIVISLLWLLATGALASAQQSPWPNLLGPVRDSDTLLSPKYGITIITNGFNRPIKAKRVVKSANWLTQMGAGRLVGQLYDEADAMPTLAQRTDDATDRIRSSWQSCGGKWAARWEQVRPS